MELHEYASALRRYWTTWVGMTLAGILGALAVVLLSAPTYEAAAQVFVASRAEGTSGSQFIEERVSSYPDIAESRSVLAPVIDELDLVESFRFWRGKVSAENPPDTSLITIAVTDGDPERAAAVANAVADEFRVVVEELERPLDGDTPVSLTVTNLADAPTDAVFPQEGLLLIIGTILGLGLGVSAAIIRSGRDTRLHDEDDVRDAWGPEGDALTVVTAPVRRRKGNRLAARPESMVARRLGPMAEQRPVQVTAVAVSPHGDDLTREFVDGVADELAEWDVPVTVDGWAGALPPSSSAPGVHLSIGTSTTPPREWRRLGRSHDGVVLVVPAGHGDRDDLREMRSIVDAARLRVLAIVLLRPSRRRMRRRDMTATSRATAGTGAALREQERVPAG